MKNDEQSDNKLKKILLTIGVVALFLILNEVFIINSLIKIFGLHNIMTAMESVRESLLFTVMSLMIWLLISLFGFLRKKWILFPLIIYTPFLIKNGVDGMSGISLFFKTTYYWDANILAILQLSLGALAIFGLIQCWKLKRWR